MRKTLGAIWLFIFWITDVAIDLRGAADHTESLKDALRLLFVGIAGTRVGIPDAVGQLALEDLQAGNVARHERNGLVELVDDMKAGAGADEIVRVRNHAPVHLTKEVRKLLLTDIVEVNHDGMQVPSIAAVARLAVIAHGGKEHERVLLD